MFISTCDDLHIEMLILLQCDRITGVRAFIDQLREESLRNVTRHMIIGPGCSSGAITVAETAPFYQLTQVSTCAETTFPSSSIVVKSCKIPLHVTWSCVCFLKYNLVILYNPRTRKRFLIHSQSNHVLYSCD